MHKYTYIYIHMYRTHARTYIYTYCHTHTHTCIYTHTNVYTVLIASDVIYSITFYEESKTKYALNHLTSAKGTGIADGGDAGSMDKEPESTGGAKSSAGVRRGQV